MSADIEKLAVFDPRIVQSRPKYAVQKGALSVTNAPFNAIAATAAQHTYNIYVPSENVFVDRALEWSSTVQLSFLVTAAAPAAGDVIAQAGRDFGLCAFPLNSLCSTLTATINDTTVVMNSQDVLKEVLRLTDYKKNRVQRTCPTYLDRYASYDDAFGSINNPIGGIENQTDYAETPNGAFTGLQFVFPSGPNAGAVLTGVQPVAAGGGNPTAYTTVNGVPVFAAADPPNSQYLITVQFRSTEKLVLSPFVFGDVHEWDTGLFGINNIQLICNLQAPSRLIRSTTRNGRTIAAPTYGPIPFSGSVVNTQFLTPSLDVPLPPKSVVPYMEFPRYITQASAPIAAGSVGTIQSQTITLPQIPDLLIVYAKPANGSYTNGAGAVDTTQGDWYFPIGTAVDGARNPLSINFDNFSGLLSSQTAEQLYAMSVKNGLEMDWDSWSGLARSVVPNATGSQAGAGTIAFSSACAGQIPLTGGFLVLKPSQDLALQSGQAPSLVGNFTLQLNLQVKNNLSTQQTPQLYIIAANSGFFESIRGSSRVIKGVLSEQDIISAPMVATSDQLTRYVGGGFMSSLATALNKAKDIYHATKPAISAVKEHLPAGVRDALGAVGYGMSGGDASGGRSGGRSAGAKKMLSQRLM